MNKLVWSLAVAALSLVGCEKNSPAPAPAVVAVNAEEKILNIYNWPDYIAQDMMANFTFCRRWLVSTGEWVSP